MNVSIFPQLSRSDKPREWTREKKSELRLVKKREERERERKKCREKVRLPEERHFHLTTMRKKTRETDCLFSLSLSVAIFFLCLPLLHIMHAGWTILMRFLLLFFFFVLWNNSIEPLRVLIRETRVERHDKKKKKKIRWKENNVFKSEKIACRKREKMNEWKKEDVHKHGKSISFFFVTSAVYNLFA